MVLVHWEPEQEFIGCADDRRRINWATRMVRFVPNLKPYAISPLATFSQRGIKPHCPISSIRFLAFCK